LRTPIAATLLDPRSDAQLRITIVALAPGAMRFVATRSLPPGSSWTAVVRRTRPLAIPITLRSSRAFERDTFACDAAVGALEAGERRRFEALLPRVPAPEGV
jgi:hypothetical protein